MQNNLKYLNEFYILKIFFAIILVLFLCDNILAPNSIEWEDNSQLYRQQINLSGAGSVIDNLTYILNLNNLNVGSNFNFTLHRNSLRFYYYNQSSQITSSIPHHANFWSTINNNASLYVKIPYLDNTNDTIIFMYYGDLSKTNSENYCAVYIFCDLFDDSTINNPLNTVDNDAYSGTLFNEQNGILNITAGGRDTWTSQDEYASVYVSSISGDVDVRAIVLELEYVNVWAKSGIMFKNDITSSGSSTGYNFMVRTPGNGYSFQSDTTGNGFLNSHTGAGSPSVSPSFVRIVKSGTSFTGYYSKTSLDSWNSITTRTISTASSIQDIGLSLTSHAGATLADTSYDNFTIRRYTTDTISASFLDEEIIINELSYQINTPSSILIENIPQNTTRTFNVSFICVGGDISSNCGNITASLLYNHSGTFIPISQTFQTPTWTTSQVNQSLTPGYNVTIDFIWIVNLTGAVNSVSDFLITFNTNNSDIVPINTSVFSLRSVQGNTINFNQSSYSYLPIVKGSTNLTTNISIISDNGNNTNIILTCVSGDCSEISDNFIDGVNLLEGNSQTFELSCDATTSGNYSATFQATSNEYNGFTTLVIDCQVTPIFGPITGNLISHLEFANSSIFQNYTFSFSAVVNCTGSCGNISAYAIYDVESWWDLSWQYRQRLNYSVSNSTNSGYQVLIRLNSTNIGTNFNFSSSCDEIRIIHDNTELDYWIEICNSTTDELGVWAEMDNSFLEDESFILELYYGNSNASSQSNAANVFLEDQIHLTVGDCPSSDGACNYLDNVADGQTVRANINESSWSIQGITYAGSINYASNPYGSDDNYYMRFRALYIPKSSGTYTFGTASDDGSNAGLWNYDGYGFGLSTPTSLTSLQDIVTDWYGGHGSGTCGSTAAVERSRSLVGGKGYWVDYIMHERTGGQDAEFCINDGGGYDNFGSSSFPGEIFSRYYVENEPTTLSITDEESALILTLAGSTPLQSITSQPQSCIPIEDGNCLFTWTLNATGLINQTVNASVYFSSSISSIDTLIVNYTTFIIRPIDIPIITLLSPLNSTKIFDLDYTNFIILIDDNDDFFNVTLNLDNGSFYNFSCNASINCSYTINTDLRKSFSWYINLSDSDGNIVNSSVYEFMTLQGASYRLQKNISSTVSNIFNIQISYENNHRISATSQLFDFVDNGYTGGSFSPLFTGFNAVVGGLLYHWNMTLNTGVSQEFDYSIAKTSNPSSIINNYIVGAG